jgi:hypothetical protein
MSLLQILSRSTTDAIFIYLKLLGFLIQCVSFNVASFSDRFALETFPQIASKIQDLYGRTLKILKFPSFEHVVLFLAPIYYTEEPVDLF